MRLTLIAAALASAATIAPAHAEFSQLYAFVDSLGEVGNFEIALGFDPTPAALGYAPGRFSNGFVFPDYLSLALFGQPTAPSLAGGTNYGFGGALATSDGGIPDLAEQIGLFALDTGGVADPDALYLINVGGNDGFAILNGAPLAPAAVGQAIAGAITQLAAFGARDFLINNVVDLAVAPLVNGNEAAATAVSVAVNAGIDAALNALVLPADARLFRFDAFAFSQAVAANPAAFGLGGIDQETTCISIFAGPACTGLYFMDDVHPTTIVHAVFGRAIFQIVPEPAALALFGLGALALGMTRRRG